MILVPVSGSTLTYLHVQRIA
ncbi:hypothetical protein C5167_029765 [Papaver somniferum]|nr:hypothetical protein C5167_029765 [Papaver somniferum]